MLVIYEQGREEEFEFAMCVGKRSRVAQKVSVRVQGEAESFDMDGQLGLSNHSCILLL
jgi:hypothetical protein